MKAAGSPNKACQRRTFLKFLGQAAASLALSPSVGGGQSRYAVNRCPMYSECGYGGAHEV
ncbi:MAG: twin-arginine translocation signal domain-containing protein [Planctomycetes bacterium]|nr:twin-arginine translocation signal domain-containing protein [Planctomycetota bacterium]